MSIPTADSPLPFQLSSVLTVEVFALCDLQPPRPHCVWLLLISLFFLSLLHIHSVSNFYPFFHSYFLALQLLTSVYPYRKSRTCLEFSFLLSGLPVDSGWRKHRTALASLFCGLWHSITWAFRSAGAGGGRSMPVFSYPPISPLPRCCALAVSLPDGSYCFLPNREYTHCQIFCRLLHAWPCLHFHPHPTHPSCCQDTPVWSQSFSLFPRPLPVSPSSEVSNSFGKNTLVRLTMVYPCPL